jgi:ribose 5-phosphate isomerase B
MSLTVAIAADHGGFALKEDLIAWLSKQDYIISDRGAEKFVPGDDYPDYAREIGRFVAAGRAECGILICGSGVGASVAANKIPGVRAGLCHDTYSAHQGVEHDDVNILCLGARVIGLELAKEVVTAFLGASFSGEDRHCRRLQKVQAIEDEALKGDGQPI